MLQAIDMAATRPSVKRQKQNTRGGKGESTKLTEHPAKMKTSTTPTINTTRQPVMKAPEKEKDTRQRNTARYAAKKRNAWVPPGSSSSGGGSQ